MWESHQQEAMLRVPIWLSSTLTSELGTLGWFGAYVVCLRSRGAGCLHKTTRTDSLCKPLRTIRLDMSYVLYV